MGDAFHVKRHGNCVQARLKWTNKSRSLSGGKRQRESCDASKICLRRKINLSSLSGKNPAVFLQFNHPTGFIRPYHLSSPTLGPFSRSQHLKKKNKTAYHDDEGDRSYKTPYEVIVHT